MKRKKITMMVMFVLTVSLVSAQETWVGPTTCIKVEEGTTLDFSGGSLYLMSGGATSASLIDYGSVTYSGGGEANVRRSRPGSMWHLISSPINNAVSGMFIDDYLQFHSEVNNGWTDIVSTNSNLGIMQGYAFWSDIEIIEIFSGYTNTGSLNKSFTQNGLGWNLVGNPSFCY